MGVFNDIWVPCPNCGDRFAVQSKGAHDLRMAVYHLESAEPGDIQELVFESDPHCPSCGSRVAIKYNMQVWTECAS